MEDPFSILTLEKLKEPRILLLVLALGNKFKMELLLQKLEQKRKHYVTVRSLVACDNPTVP